MIDIDVIRYNTFSIKKTVKTFGQVVFYATYFSYVD